MLTLDQIKEYLGITGTEYDDLLESLNVYVTAEIEAYIDRVIPATDYEGEVLHYTFNINDLAPRPLIAVRGGTAKLFPLQYPLKDVVMYSDGDIVDASSYVVSDKWITMKSYVSDAYDTLTIDYTGGYDPIPEALILVALDGVKALFEQSAPASQGTENVKSKSLGDFSVTYGTASDSVVTNGSQFMKQYIAKNNVILDRYKRIGI